jgi:exoribonuclease-2
LISAAKAVSPDIELELAWEFAPEDDFGFAELARDYFSDTGHAGRAGGHAVCGCMTRPTTSAVRARAGFAKPRPMFWPRRWRPSRRKSRLACRFRPGSPSLATGSCPQAIRDQLYKILFKPDKNAPEYKAVVEASRATHLGPLDLLMRSGAIDSPYQFHWRRFLLENFPKGTGFAKLEAPLITDDLPLAQAQAFSIDDSATTEIDDALSVQGLGSGTVLLGIHIAAPGLAIKPGSPMDQLGRARLSTVYMPGYKITMLPDDVVQKYTLMEGQNCPAVSLYVTLERSHAGHHHHRNPAGAGAISANLRHDQLDTIVTTEWLEDPNFQHKIDPLPISDKREQLSFLYRWQSS